MKKIALLALMPIASPCVAQVNWGAPQPGFDANAALRAYDAGRERRMREDEYARQRDADMMAEAYANAAIERRKDVGRLVSEGKCAEAKKMALRGGDFDLAETVSRIC